jgi:hypothetical protein
MITLEEFELYEQLGLDIDDLIKFDRQLEQSMILLAVIQGEL